jgi:hypothetical protein
MTLRALKLITLAALALMTACAGRPPVEPEAGSAGCPQLTGSYCANGEVWEEGSTAVTRTYLPYRLGIDSTAGWDTVDRVDLDGATDGVLTIVLRAGAQEFARAELSGEDFFCGDERLMLRMNAMMWSGGLELGGYGASSGWRQFRRGEDGMLRVDEFRRETGAIFFVIPLRFKTDSHMRFLPAADGCASDLK